MVKVGSARHDENGNLRGGKAGDQTGHEVETQRWYKHKKGWVVIRAKSSTAREKIARDMEWACENPHIGYDQSQNGTLFAAAKKVDFNCSKVTVKCETDCSRLVRVCCWYAGIEAPLFYTGTEVDGEISAPLLENIFEPNTPLHDGAVVIRGNRVAAAACILPLTEASGVSRELGTRHRAGIGLSESTDALVLIVSEETGTMSVAQGGMLRRPLIEKDLRTLLEELYTEQPSRLGSFISSLKGIRKEAKA